jgi:hypothetical protein
MYASAIYAPDDLVQRYYEVLIFPMIEHDWNRFGTFVRKESNVAMSKSHFCSINDSPGIAYS